MTTLTVLVPDDQAPGQNKEREYEVAFSVLRGERRSMIGRLGPKTVAEFDVFQVRDASGALVRGSEFELVATHVRDCYYAEMLAAARGTQ